MPTLLDAKAREAILHRLRQLHPSSQAQWGKLDAPRLLCHLADQLRVGLGDIPTAPANSWAGRTIVKWLVIYTPMRPPPGKVETAPEMLTTAPTTWNADLQAVETLIGRLATTPTNAVHPFFGRLDHSGWARLAWKHLDHHLRQFGC